VGGLLSTNQLLLESGQSLDLSYSLGRGALKDLEFMNKFGSLGAKLCQWQVEDCQALWDKLDHIA
jgi:hypothetical protein